MHSHTRRPLAMLGAAGVLASAASATEEPPFRSLEREGDLELRLYAPMVVAETLARGDMDRASGDGFRLLADYIFNRNGGQSGEGRRIAMTAPVGMQAEDGGWRVHFVMPASVARGDLPQPANPKVRLREVPAQMVVALRFPGRAGEGRVQAKIQAALAWLRARGYAPAAAPQVARYDPPWTLPPFRRNEILIPVR